MAQTKTRGQEATMQALLELSGFPQDVSGQNVNRMIAAIRKAPDPETACQVITEEFGAEGALERKWRQVIQKTWLDCHPNASEELSLPITSSDVIKSPLLLDARAFLEELSLKPAKLVQEKNDFSIKPKDLPRFLAAIPSFHYDESIVAEHEWGYIPLRRLRAILQAARLIRIFKGELRVIASRRDKFLDLPLPQQFYVLWHTDAYHTNWGEFASSWDSYIHTLQHYLPMLWEISEGAREGQYFNSRDITRILMNVFAPIWQQEHLGEELTTTQSFFRAYEQATLPAALEQVIIHDLFIRHGLFEKEASFLDLFQPAGGGISTRPNGTNVRLSRLGQIILSAERGDAELPCGIDILK